MSVESRGPKSLQEKAEFDQVTFEQIQGISDAPKLRRLEFYMRAEGFVSTADAVRQRLHDIGSQTFKDDEEHANNQAKDELNRAREDLTSWRQNLAEGRADPHGRVAGERVAPPVRSLRAAAAKGPHAAPSDGSSAPDFAPSERHWAADREKEKGNELFKSGEFRDAVDAYTKSLALASKDATLSNRAAAYLKLELFDRAIEDCTAVLANDPKHVKALMRRAVARTELLQHESALEDVNAALIEAPGNKELERIRDKVIRKIPQAVTQVQIEEISGSEDDEYSDVENEKDFNEARTSVQVLPDVAIDEEEVGKVVEITDEYELQQLDLQSLGASCPASESSNQAHMPAPEEPDPALASQEELTRIPIEICEDSEDETSDEEDYVEAGEEPREETHAHEAGTALAGIPSPVRAQTSGDTATAPARKAPGGASDVAAAASDANEDNAVRMKEMGNAAYASGDLRGALHWYTESLLRVPSSAVYSNRAQVHIKLGNNSSAVSDCTSALERDATNVKALYRRGVANGRMARYEQALSDLLAVRGRLPGNGDILCEIDAMEAAIAAKKAKPAAADEESSTPPEKKGSPPMQMKAAVSPPVTAQPPVSDLEPPKSSTEFETRIRILLKQNNAQSLGEYVYLMTEDQYGRLFRKALNVDILGAIIVGLDAGFSKTGGNRGADYCVAALTTLAKADRFLITSRMLIAKHKRALGSLFDKCASSQVAQGRVATLKKEYGYK